MDGGQFRVPQRTSRGTVSRPEPARRPTEKPQPEPEKLVESTPTRPTPSAPRQSKSESRGSSPRPPLPIRLIVAIVVLVALIVGSWFAWSQLKGTAAPGIDTAKYQAVFLVNGDIYFGKLQAAGSDYMKLTNIYYIQSPTAESTDKETQQTATDQNNVKLIKLGEEIYGPEDAMTISRDQIMLYENLKSDSKVAQAIDKSK